MTAVTHPGEIIGDEIEARGMSARALATALGVPATRIAHIVGCRRALTAETALRLARYFGGSAKVWLGLQADYDLAAAETRHGDEIARTVCPVA